MKSKIKIAVIGGIAAVLAAVTPVIIPIIFKHKDPDNNATKNISVSDSKGVVIGDIKNNSGDITGGNKITHTGTGDLITGGSKTINNFNVYPEYEQLRKRIEELEQDLKDIPLDNLESRLRKSEKLEEARKQAQDFEHQILRLAETFTKIEINTDRLRQAKHYFGQGKLKEADTLLKEEALLADQKRLLDAKARKTSDLEALGKHLLSNASEFLIKAQITATDFNNPNRFEDTRRFYEQSIQSCPTIENLFGYAYFLAKHNQHNDAERYYHEVLERFGNEMDAPTRATTLNNFGILQCERNEFEEALKSYKEALGIYRKLAQTKLQGYLPDVAATLNNMGALQYKKNEFEEALKSYKEALEIYRELAKTNPQSYLPDVAMTLNNLGVLQSDKNEFEEALKSYKEALEIYRKLAQTNRQSYLPYVAGMLYNLGNLQYKKSKCEEALKSYKEALEIRRELALTKPQSYLPDVAMTLNNLGNLQCEKNEFEEALKSYKEALEIRRKLAQTNPQSYLPDVAVTLATLSIFYKNGEPDKELSIKYAVEALRIFAPFLEKAPYTRQYAQPAFEILQYWGVDVEKALAEGVK